MRCLITAGPTFEPLDDVRRLTNFSSGKLGCRLADFLFSRGHDVLLLLGEGATFRATPPGVRVEPFTTTRNLRARLQAHAAKPPDALFHAAAVNDFMFGKVFERGADGALIEAASRKYSTRSGTLMAELLPTPKVIAELRDWFPASCLVGWKYETEGTRESVVAKALAQISECRTSACVANGPAYGFGFGLVSHGTDVSHFSDSDRLYAALEELATRPGWPSR